MARSFENDDILGDILSDGSNDSFFEEPKVLAKRSSLTKTPEKKSVSDLFGLDTDKPKEKPKEDWLGLRDAEKPETVERRPTLSKQTKKTSFDDNEDILNTLGLEKKPETKEPELSKKIEPTKKSALMESIFGPPKSEASKPFDDILKETKARKDQEEVLLLPPKKQENVGYTPSDLPRETRRPRRQSSGIMDPLGLFSEPKSVEPPKNILKKGEGDAGALETEVLYQERPKELKTKSAPNIKALPEWLGGGSPVKTHKSETGIEKEDKKEEIPAREVAKEQPIEVVETVSNPMLESLITQQKLATSHIEYQNTSIAMQQQESQLLMALQLKKYEENLAGMQRKQQEIIIKQEQQFSSLLERQFAKQHIMENNMRLQQERINSHIQMLLSQPSITSRAAKEEQELNDVLKTSNANENSKIYEGMIATLRERHHEEIFILNESYKKQIVLLEDSMVAVENRLKEELEKLSEQFRETITHLKQEHEAEIEKYKQKIQETSSLHVQELKQMRDNQNRTVEEIKYEYSTMVENMKQIKQTESSVIKDADSYNQRLDTNLQFLDVNSKILSEIQDKIRSDYGVLSLAREESLKAKEEEVKLMRATLEKCREAAETERAQLISLVRNLELKLVEQSQNAQEERWALQQASATLAARSAAFDRETDFARAAIEREKDQLKTLKETMLAEQEKIMLHLTEEKLAIAAERSRLETAAKLNTNYDSQKAKTEVEAAVRVAKEAAELTDRERESLHQQHSDLEILKRNLLDKKRKLALRDSELQEALRDADRKAQDGEKALADAKALEAKCNAKFREIQGQLMSLTSREKRVAEEKYALSKERIALHSNLRQAKRCSLCTTDNVRGEEGVEEAVEQDYSPRLFVETDPDILRLRSQINEERSFSESMK